MYEKAGGAELLEKPRVAEAGRWFGFVAQGPAEKVQHTHMYLRLTQNLGVAAGVSLKLRCPRMMWPAGRVRSRIVGCGTALVAQAPLFMPEVICGRCVQGPPAPRWPRGHLPPGARHHVLAGSNPGGHQGDLLGD